MSGITDFLDFAFGIIIVSCIQKYGKESFLVLYVGRIFLLLFAQRVNSNRFLSGLKKGGIITESCFAGCKTKT